MAINLYLNQFATDPAPQPLSFQQDTNTPQAIDLRLWLSSDDEFMMIQAASNPGVDPITISIADDNPASGYTVNDVRLAKTKQDLDTATPGATLTLQNTILPGEQDFWIRVQGAGGGVNTPGTTSTEISITTNDIIEVENPDGLG